MNIGSGRHQTSGDERKRQEKSTSEAYSIKVAMNRRIREENGNFSKPNSAAGISSKG